MLSGVDGGVVLQFTSRDGQRNKLAGFSAVDHALDEDIEQELGVSRTRGGLGVELDGEVRETLSTHPDTFVGSVVGVLEQLFPSRLEGADVDFVTVVLRGDVTPAGSGSRTGNVHASVSVLHLGSLGTRRKSQQLMTETDTKDGDLGGLHGRSQVVDGLGNRGRVTGTVG